MNAPRVVLLAAVLIFLAVLCTSKPTRNVNCPVGFTHVVYWEKWSGYEAHAARAVVDAFNKTIGFEKKIFVEYVPVANVDVKAQVAIIGGDPPDILGLWQRNVTGFAAADALTPLDEIDDTATVKSLALEPLVTACNYHDRLFAVPSTPATIALYWNRGVFKEHTKSMRDAGLDPTQAPNTLAGFKKVCEILSTRSDGGKIQKMGYLPGTAGSFDWYWHTWPIWWGGTWIEFSTGNLDVAQRDVVESHEWVQDYTRGYGFDDVLEFESSLGEFGAPDNPFLSEKLAMVRQGPWMAHLIRRYRPDLDFGVAPFPTRSGNPIGFFEMDVLAIPRGAKNPKAAWTFVNWLYQAKPLTIDAYRDMSPWLGDSDSQADSAEKSLQLKPVEWLCWLHGKNSPLATLSDAFVATHPNSGIDVHEFLLRESKTATVPALPNWSELLSEYRATYGQVWISDCDIPKKFQQCQEEIDSLTQNYIARCRRWGIAYP
ncbi:MAG: hypothetical protein DHS20C16_08430 [Phycisphaerae bacterium]|nr:MAG: hypothetical protein DHS20C16_08430 [Phycisphaerae bacterium]